MVAGRGGDAGARPLGIAALAMFFAAGALISLASLLSLATPGGPLEPMWRLNPRAREAFRALGPWGLVLMAVVCAACVATAIGLWRRQGWGHRLAIAMFVAQLVGDVVNVSLGIERRAAFGVPIVALLLIYLASPRVRAHFVSKR